MNATKVIEKRKRRKTRPIPEKSIRKLIRSAESLRDRIIISLLVNTGQRRIDIANLRIEDFDLVGQTISLTQKKTKQGVFLPLPDDLVSDLRIYIHDNLKRKKGYLFPGKKRGEPISKWSINKIVNNVVENSGLHNITPHDFRATFLTRAGKMGIPPKMIVDTFGINYSTVMKYYQSFTPEESREAFSKVHIT
ncbi:MAG: tyrosine-type recombinase/integrase [Candidatus Hodarchaeales archaeon]